jgi:hypothetical protein
MAVNDSTNESQCDAAHDATMSNNREHSNHATHTTSCDCASSSISTDSIGKEGPQKDLLKSSNKLQIDANAGQNLAPDSSLEPSDCCLSLNVANSAANEFNPNSITQSAGVVNENAAYIEKEIDAYSSETATKIREQGEKEDFNSESKIIANSVGVDSTSAKELCASCHSKESDASCTRIGENPSSVATSKSQVSGVVTSAFPTPCRGGKKRRAEMEVKEKVKVHNPDDPDSVCGLVFVRSSTTARMLYRLFKVDLLIFLPVLNIGNTFWSTLYVPAFIIVAFISYLSSTCEFSHLQNPRFFFLFYSIFSFLFLSLQF